MYEGERGNIVGLLLVKSLIVLDPEDATPIKEVYQEGSLLKSSSTEPLFELLDKFQTGKSMTTTLWMQLLAFLSTFSLITVPKSKIDQ